MKKTVKKMGFLVVIILILSACTNRTEELIELQLQEELKITEIEKDVFLVTHSFPWAGNSLLLALDKKDILWIDTPYTPEATSLVLDWIQSNWGNNCSITEINTGFHIDNLGGNQELIKRNIPIYGSERTCELLETRSPKTMSRMQEWLSQDRYEKYRRVYSELEFYKPTRTFDINEEQTLKIGSEEVIIYFPGPSHTYDNLVVYIPGKQLLFGGCMLLSSNAEKAGYIEDGDLYEWERSLLNLENHFQDIRVVIPGHGNPGDSMLITHTRDIVARTER